MTPEQEIEFKNHGCISRCLLALANDFGNPMTKSEFIDKFSNDPKFDFWKKVNKCGIMDTGLILDVIRELKLGTSFQIYINKEKVREYIREKGVKGILLFTEKLREDDGSLKDYYHCSLVGLSVPMDGGCLVIQVDDDIKAQTPTRLTDSDIEQLKGYFLLIY